jgi:TonB family protein
MCSRANFRSMISNSSKSLLAAKMLFCLLTLLCVSNTSVAQSANEQPAQTQTSSRKVKSNPPPEYPELARRMSITGTARVLVTVANDGSVTTVKELGGNPVLVAALVKAVKKWKYEPADHENEIEVKYEFTMPH